MKTPEECWHLLMMNSRKEETLQTIKEIQDEAYNQCLTDLSKDDVLPDKTVNFTKYTKK